MKKILLTILLATIVNADSFSITGLAFSKHKDTNFNEKHNWIGFKYKFKESEHYDLYIEGADFKNSFGDDTKFLVAGVAYYPLVIDDFKMGITLNAGYQRGYCINGYQPTSCKVDSKNKSLFALPSFIVKYNRVSISFLKIPAVTVARLELELFKW